MQKNYDIESLMRSEFPVDFSISLLLINELTLEGVIFQC